MSVAKPDAVLTLGCCVGQPDLRRRIQDAVNLEGGTMVSLGVSDFRTGDCPKCLDGVIYDLHPWDDSALHVVERIAAMRPPPPLFLYPPAHVPAVSSLLVRAGALGTDIFAEFQCDRQDGVPRLRRGLRTLFQKTPKVQLKAVIRGCLQDTPSIVSDYVDAVVDLLYRGEGKVELSIISLTRRLHSTTRTIERSCKAVSLPTPKELCGWITLIHLADLARRRRVTISSVANDCRINTNQLYRLRRRLLREAAEIRTEASAADFEDILQAFRKRCKQGTGIPTLGPRDA